MITKIPAGYGGFAWKDSCTLYVSAEDCLIEVRLQSGVAEMGEIIPIGQRVMALYGFLDNHAVVATAQGIELGHRILVPANQASGVLVTNTHMFVSTSEHVIVFDRTGYETNRKSVEEPVRLGSIGRDSGTVYGLAGSVIVRVHIRDETLDIEEVCDLERALRGRDTGSGLH